MSYRAILRNRITVYPEPLGAKLFLSFFVGVFIFIFYISSLELTDHYKKICKSEILIFDPNDQIKCFFVHDVKY